MNQVVGRIVSRETGEGVPNRLIVVYDAQPAARAPHTPRAQSAENNRNWDQFTGRRLGSTLTDRSGAFALQYTVDSGRSESVDLQLVVADEEDELSGPEPAIRHVSAIRRDAATLETYLISVSTDEGGDASSTRRSLRRNSGARARHEPDPEMPITREPLLSPLFSGSQRAGPIQQSRSVKQAWKPVHRRSAFAFASAATQQQSRHAFSASSMRSTSKTRAAIRCSCSTTANTQRSS